MRLLDALAGLFVRLHLAGFFWGDCSLSNTLFRRDAGALAAYLVDAETGELHPRLTDGQRDARHRHRDDEHRRRAARPAGGRAARRGRRRRRARADLAQSRYESLWDELTHDVLIPPGENYLINQRLRRLNDLGFDVGEMTINTEPGGMRLKFDPQVVDAGHHQRRLFELTGLRVQSNQARGAARRTSTGTRPSGRTASGTRSGTTSPPAAGWTRSSTPPSTSSRWSCGSSCPTPSCSTRSTSTGGCCPRRPGHDVGRAAAVARLRRHRAAATCPTPASTCPPARRPRSSRPSSTDGATGRAHECVTPTPAGSPSAATMDVRRLPGLTIAKLAVGPMNNNAYLLRCTASDEGLLIDAANEADRLRELVDFEGPAGVGRPHHPPAPRPLAGAGRDGRLRRRRGLRGRRGRRRAAGGRRRAAAPRRQRSPSASCRWRSSALRGHTPGLGRRALPRPRGHAAPVHRRLAVPGRRRARPARPRTSAR